MRRKAGWKKNGVSTSYNGYSGVRKNLATDNEFLQHYPSTTKFNRNMGSRQRIGFEGQDDIDETLSAIMGKVKHLQKRFHTKNDEMDDDVYSERLNSKL